MANVDKKANYYVDNARLREVVIEFNRTNLDDSGEWCASYLQRLENKHNKGKMTDEKYEIAKDFITNKVRNIKILQDKYQKMNPAERKDYIKNFVSIKDEMTDYFLKIIDGRINSFGLRKNPVLKEHIDDIIQDAYIAVMTYINRYNDALATSAFAYVTQLATNSIIFSINEIKEREEKFVSGLDYYDNINTIDDPSANNLEKFID